jgi:hypothetical protein
MKTTLLSLFIFASTFASAETTTMDIKGMHCGSCEAAVRKAVCKNKDFKGLFESCEPSVVDADKELGQLKLVTKAPLTTEQKSAVEKAITGTKRTVLSSATSAK